MSGVTGPLRQVSALRPLQAGLPLHADLRCYRVTGRALIWRRRAALASSRQWVSGGLNTRRGDSHPPEDCTDDDCPRYPCVIWRKGFAAGFRKGYSQGWDEGYAKGFAEGYAKGYAARPPLIVYVPSGK